MEKSYNRLDLNSYTFSDLFCIAKDLEELIQYEKSTNNDVDFIRKLQRLKDEIDKKRMYIITELV